MTERDVVFYTFIYLRNLFKSYLSVWIISESPIRFSTMIWVWTWKYSGDILKFSSYLSLNILVDYILTQKCGYQQSRKAILKIQSWTQYMKTFWFSCLLSTISSTNQSTTNGINVTLQFNISYTFSNFMNKITYYDFMGICKSMDLLKWNLISLNIGLLGKPKFPSCKISNPFDHNCATEKVIILLSK